MSNKRARRADAFEEIERLKAGRRMDVIKCAGALAAIVVILGGKIALEVNGIIQSGNMAMGAVVMISAVGLAILGGTSSIDFTRSGHEIEGVRARAGISREELKAHERGTR